MELINLVVECDLLDPALNDVVDVRWREHLSEGFDAQIRIDVHVQGFDASTLLGHDLTVVVQRGTAETRLTGHIVEAEEVQPLRSAASRVEGVAVQLTLRPAFELLHQVRRTRIFQNQSVPEIVQAVLDEGLGAMDRSATLDLNGEYPTREYCVQYQESDRDFVNRLLEEEGIWYTFHDDGGVETMLLRDQNEGSQQVEGDLDGVIRYRAAGLEVEDHEDVFDARMVSLATATRVSTRHYDWSRGAPVEGDSEDDVPGPGAEQYQQGHGFTLTLSDFSGRFGAHDGAQRAVRWREALGSPRKRLLGSSTVIGFAAGRLFELSEHPVPEANGEYLLVSVEHNLSRRGGELAEYENVFVAQPAAREFRPAMVTPRPLIQGVETATVVGPSGQEIHTDEHARIKVQFHWDRAGANDENSSCFVRCAQAWAGDGWGFLFVPRIGMEVIVTFLQGDPDRPLVTGAVYKGDHQPPYALPGDKTKSTIKSNSSLGGGGFNELRFEDLAGSEEVFLHAQRNLDELVKNNHTTNVGANQRNEVKGNQEQIVHKDQDEDVGTDQDLDVTGDRKVTVTGGFTETLKAKETRVVSAGSDEKITALDHHKVTAKGLEETITGGQTRTVAAPGLGETIIGAHSLTINGGALTDTVDADLFRKASNITFDASASILMNGTSATEIKAKSRIKIKAPSGYVITSTNQTQEVHHSFFSKCKFGIAGIRRDLIGLRTDRYTFGLDVGVGKADVVGANLGVYPICTAALTGGKVDRGTFKFKANILKGECKGWEEIK